MADITVVQGDDWRGIYLDGKLYYEGHSIPEFIWVGLLNRVSSTVVIAEERFADLDWLMDEGRLPDDLTSVVYES